MAILCTIYNLVDPTFIQCEVQSGYSEYACLLIGSQIITECLCGDDMREIYALQLASCSSS